ncbi:hypothetical protein CBM2605_A140142 [Cupriavidus neocaledonicus]|uniref:Uncharacterized protein n=1 Tax=Cupriavidus neocaledonicus TaxID=1040979 RepID=A0ABY1UXP6_9BURK|nr:hypothetical protein CBM2605_A140142 [Cupriavidus neocaledonicus]
MCCSRPQQYWRRWRCISHPRRSMSNTPKAGSNSRELAGVGFSSDGVGPYFNGKRHEPWFWLSGTHRAPLPLWRPVRF